MSGSSLLRLRRIVLYVGLTLALMPVQALLLATRSRLASLLPLAYHRLCCRLLGFTVECHGAPSARRPTLFVANHTSYLDITIFGGLIEGCFVAKSEVARWPLFGWLARLQRSVFVDRRARSTQSQRDALRRRLDVGDSLILFPEGTSNDGMRVLPFKSALLSAADHAREGVPVPVQPVSIAYVRLDGIPLGRFYRPFLAWYGDMAMAPHLWAMLGLGTVTVIVQFHPAVSLAEFGSRKALADHCRHVIAAGVAAALAGRQTLQPAAAPAEASPTVLDALPATADAGAL